MELKRTAHRRATHKTIATGNAPKNFACHSTLGRFRNGVISLALENDKHRFCLRIEPEEAIGLYKFIENHIHKCQDCGEPFLTGPWGDKIPTKCKACRKTING